MIDDERDCINHAKYLSEKGVDITKDWKIVRSYNQFRKWITENGVPDVVAFDHDLADVPSLRINLPIEEWFDLEENREYTGTDCARWLVNYCIDNNFSLPEYLVHSSNGEGAKNIISIFKTFEKYHGK